MNTAIIVIPLAAVIAPLLATQISKVLVIPLVVFEIILGVVIGPDVLGWVSDGDYLENFSQFGLAFLFFMAGFEIDLKATKGRYGKRALVGWLASAFMALAIGFIIGDNVESSIIIAIALTGTALGTITPILRDSGLTKGPLGKTLSVNGAVGEFFPLVAITVFLSGKKPQIGIAALIVFLAIAGFAFYASSRREHAWLKRMVTSTLHTSGQFAVRIVVFLLAALSALAIILGVDFLLGAFAAGMLGKVVLRGSPQSERDVIDGKLEAISFGFFVPIFFVTTGVTFPLDELFSSPATLIMVPIFALLILVVRGVPGFLVPIRPTSLSDRRTSALMTATTLPLVIAVCSIGMDHHALNETTSAALIGGALLTVIFFPMLALVGRKDRAFTS